METHEPREEQNRFMHPITLDTLEAKVYYDILETQGWPKEMVEQFRRSLECKCMESVAEAAVRLGYEVSFPNEPQWYMGGLDGMSGCPTYWMGVVYGVLSKKEE